MERRHSRIGGYLAVFTTAVFTTAVFPTAVSYHKGHKGHEGQLKNFVIEQFLCDLRDLRG